MNATDQVANAGGAQPPKLLDRVVAKMRLLHYSKRTERAYVDWIKRYIPFHNKRRPREMGAAEIEAFLTYLAVEGNVTASTQNQAFSALLFLYQKILEFQLPDISALHPAIGAFAGGVVGRGDANGPLGVRWN